MTIFNYMSILENKGKINPFSNQFGSRVDLFFEAVNSAGSPSPQNKRDMAKKIKDLFITHFAFLGPVFLKYFFKEYRNDEQFVRMITGYVTKSRTEDMKYLLHNSLLEFMFEILIGKSKNKITGNKSIDGEISHFFSNVMKNITNTDGGEIESSAAFKNYISRFDTPAEEFMDDVYYVLNEDNIIKRAAKYALRRVALGSQQTQLLRNIFIVLGGVNNVTTKNITKRILGARTGELNMLKKAGISASAHLITRGIMDSLVDYLDSFRFNSNELDRLKNIVVDVLTDDLDGNPSNSGQITREFEMNIRSYIGERLMIISKNRLLSKIVGGNQDSQKAR